MLVYHPAKSGFSRVGSSRDETINASNVPSSDNVIITCQVGVSFCAILPSLVVMELIEMEIYHKN